MTEGNAVRSCISISSVPALDPFPARELLLRLRRRRGFGGFLAARLASHACDFRVGLDRGHGCIVEALRFVAFDAGHGAIWIARQILVVASDRFFVTATA